MKLTRRKWLRGIGAAMLAQLIPRLPEPVKSIRVKRVKPPILDSFGIDKQVIQKRIEELDNGHYYIRLAAQDTQTDGWLTVQVGD